MPEFKNQVVGLIRFSYAAEGDFYPGFDTITEMEAFLFNKQRLKRRFALFEKYTLPALRRQTDPDFTCIFLVGLRMPDDYLDRLRTLVADLPCARLVVAPPAPHYSAIKKAFATVATNAGITHLTTFRLDDDDAFDDTHIARLKSTALRLSTAVDMTRPLALAFNLGIYVEIAEDLIQIFDAAERTPLSVGAALVAPKGFADNIYFCNHRALPQFFNTYSNAADHVFLRTIHRDNKSKPHFSGHQGKLSEPQLRAVLREKFGHDYDDLQRL